MYIAPPFSAVFSINTVFSILLITSLETPSRKPQDPVRLTVLLFIAPPSLIAVFFTKFPFIVAIPSFTVVKSVPAYCEVLLYIAPPEYALFKIKSPVIFSTDPLI